MTPRQSAATAIDFHPKRRRNPTVMALLQQTAIPGETVARFPG
jgi:hypothetical protein